MLERRTCTKYGLALKGTTGGGHKKEGADILDGTCSYFHLMKSGGDHTELDEMAKLIGADYIPIKI
jgi:hypothetical protein